MSRVPAVLLGIVGAILTGVTLAAAHWLSIAHISTNESIIAGVVAAVGIMVMMRAYLQERRTIVMVFEAATLLSIWFVYREALIITARSPMMRTMADLRTIATAVEARATDVDEYPPARDIDDLAHYLVPTYIRELPRVDGYRHPYRYEAWKADPRHHGNDHYAVASAGYDWKWDARSLRDYKAQGTHARDCDIVYSNGAFIVYPDDGARPASSTEWGTSTAKPEPVADAKRLFDEATALYRSDHYAEAIPKFEQYLAVAPNDALANARIGICLGHLGRSDAAIPYLMRASALDPTDYQSRSNLGLIYDQLNRAREGLEWEQQADKIKPNDPEVLNNLATVMRDAGDKQGAIAVYERVVKLAPNVPLYRQNLERARRQ